MARGAEPVCPPISDATGDTRGFGTNRGQVRSPAMLILVDFDAISRVVLSEEKRVDPATWAGAIWGGNPPPAQQLATAGACP